ncbi:putative fatty acyl-CoA reductase CG5065 [Arctopsyche grandis]|uniref:putative fatty acyl-CoA reductase CG5065 n=1 Tax=Arctopsyche grandis TaxID=121162 RepID=UPI00406D9101
MGDLINENNMPTIAEFFEGKTIFITGGTGFMGKVLIEKLLWSCPGIKTIYLLLRPKKGVEGKERLVNLEKSPLFERLRNRDPNFFLQKVNLINGNVSEVNLGLSPEDRQTLVESVSVIYHAAASVRFDDPLKEAIMMNARGTREIMMLAKEMKQIEIVLHVSTTYCNTDKSVVEEILYPAHADWQTTIKIAENADENTMNILTPKYLGNLPNTYVFTKSLAEHIVNDLRGNIPTVIFRPSIVVSSMEEPMPGWIENFNGPVGLLVACGKGIMRSMYSTNYVKTDFIPVDFAIKGMIVATWKYAAIEPTIQPVVPVINCSSANVKGVTYHEIISIGLSYVKEMPLNNILWVPGGGFTRFKTLHIMKTILFHLLPAFLVDIGLKLSGNKPMLWRLQRRVYVASNALLYYIINEWLFKNDRFLSLRSSLCSQDYKEFNYALEEIDTHEFFKNSVIGARRYLLKESDDTIPQARIHYNRMYYLDRTIKAIFWICVAWFLYSSVFVRNCISELFGYGVAK